MMTKEKFAKMIIERIESGTDNKEKVSGQLKLGFEKAKATLRLTGKSNMSREFARHFGKHITLKYYAAKQIDNMV